MNKSLYIITGLCALLASCASNPQPKDISPNYELTTPSHDQNVFYYEEPEVEDLLNPIL